MFKFLKDEKGQGAAEYMLLIGGALAIVLIALFIYTTYMNSAKGVLQGNADVSNVRSKTTNWAGLP
ncbi:Protein of unknown function DUF361 [Methanothermus fervidus DSM 2088]|uniref:Class III signal peptide n=1 Tax=Methanothermus fervidus (strain ATCC 43054 / DSM 2088 / JCM 10308 / V24 S) TaxID=523846 RepID=E3GXY6_METFV|nr:class III signal peptide-containing protein [Methanothermus fervidus]ADP77168.1 Protein of unknown function DUF361 [Methanothermus fervidus DSM 2088]